MSKCKWCGNETKLCRAHLIPDGLNKFLLGDVGGTQKLYRVEMRSNKLQSPVQTLEFDRNILCSKCDASLGKYDHALIEFFDKYISFWQTILSAEPILVKFEIQNTQRVALGFLAILYRFSLSDEYRKIKLEPEYKQKFETWFEKDELTENDLRFAKTVLVGTSAGKGNTNWFLMQYIRQVKIEGGFIYQLQMFGLHIIIMVGKQDSQLEDLLDYPPLGAQKGSVVFEMLSPKSMASFDEFKKYF